MPNPTLKEKSSNALFALRLYRLGRIWAFDDPARDLYAEPFVSGMSEMIDFAALKALGAHGPEITVVFSTQPFPGQQCEMVGGDDEAGGRWYTLQTPEGHPEPGWLCPAVLKYLPAHPDRIYAAVQR